VSVIEGVVSVTKIPLPQGQSPTKRVAGSQNLLSGPRCWPPRPLHRLGVTTVVLLAGGDGLLLLNDKQPANARGSSNAIKARRMRYSLSYL
jgi:hypothetical protein